MIIGNRNSGNKLFSIRNSQRVVFEFFYPTRILPIHFNILHLFLFFFVFVFYCILGAEISFGRFVLVVKKIRFRNFQKKFCAREKIPQLPLLRTHVEKTGRKFQSARLVCVGAAISKIQRFEIFPVSPTYLSRSTMCKHYSLVREHSENRGNLLFAKSSLIVVPTLTNPNDRFRNGRPSN